MRQNRLQQISACTDTLAELRAKYGKKSAYKFGIELAECDTLEELHRLLYEEEDE